MPVLLGNRVSSRVSVVTSRLSSRLLLSLLLCMGVFGAGLLYAQNTSDSRTVGKTSVAKRYALVIGNTNYAGDAALQNPRNDAEDMAAKLRQLGFDVMVGYDLRASDMRDKLTEFGDKIASRGPQDIALFYYAGHGLQYESKNYLIPLGANIKWNTLPSATLGVDEVLTVMQSDRRGMSIVILDACRNNPFSLGTDGRNIPQSKGLTFAAGGDNTLIAYATGEGKTAGDNKNGRNGLYTGELLKHLGTPNLDLADVFVRTRLGVLDKSKGAQDPRELNSLHGNPVLFGDGSGSVVATVVCPSGTNLVGRECVAPVVCPSGTSWNGNNCVGQVASVAKPSVSSDVWVTIPAGSFMMGCVDGDGECDDNEKGSNRRLESVSSFQLMRTEVTVDMYKKCVEAGVCSAPTDKDVIQSCNWGYSNRGDHPVNCVGWDQAVQYCDYAGGRLPSAVEFEYALRGGKKGYIYSWGNSASKVCEYANVDDQSFKRKYPNWTAFDCDDGYAETAPVGSFESNGYGLYDMGGNVRELTSVQYDGDNKEVRGGSWSNLPWDLRASSRSGYPPDHRNSDLGFRCAQ